ncbi:DedA family protein [Cellulosimicrobium cellulans]|uniref:DedA family protein n=1 Tax=Cellulosimicrobium cellulans TaxID=1710 RepID=UPI0019636A3D|nr:DedA family protein [Cellulosimicrobium cellulans]MBN0038823.1 DedA family protein [Cellulosimicrobium cellulans]
MTFSSTAVLAAESPGTGPISRITDWAVSLMESLGAPGAGVAAALENLFPPIPSEVILPLAGFTAAQGRLGLLEAILWTTAGSVVGALLLYGLGAALGADRLRAVAARLPLVRVEDVDTAEAWFARYGTTAVLVGRVIPIVRSLISIPAGVERMPLGRFLVLTVLGSGVWNTALVLLGYGLGERWPEIEAAIGTYQKGVLAVVAVLAVAYVVHLLRRRVRADAGTWRSDGAPRRHARR